MNESLLQKIATDTKGFYLPLQGPNPMEMLYQRGPALIPKSDSTSKLVRNYREQYKWPLGLAILLLIFEMFFPQRKRVRHTEAMTYAENAALKKAVTVVLLFLLPLASFASPASAAKKYQEGKFEDSLADYQKSLEKKTNDYRLYYNAGDAAYRAKKFDEAKKYFDTAVVSPDLKLQQQAYYNLGNTLYQMGEPLEEMDKKKETWEKAIRNYESALKLDPKDPEANGNLAFLKQRLEELKKQEQQQQKSDKNDSKDNKDQKDQQKQDQKDDKNQDQKQSQDKDDKDQKDQKDKQQQGKDGEKKDQDQQKQGDQPPDQQQAKDDKGKDKDKKDKDKKKGEEQQQEQAGDPGEEKNGEEGQPEGEVVKGQWTAEEAKRFLESVKQEDRALIFKPPQKANANQHIKDW